MNKLICYISPTTFTEYKPYYAHGFSEPFMGRQTNEAPICYAIDILKKRYSTLDGIIALKTSESDYSSFENCIKNKLQSSSVVELPDGFITYINTELGEPFIEVLSSVIRNITKDDNIIIDTSGGPRTAVTMLTLLSRFLIHRGCKILFSINAEYNRNNNSGTLTITQDNALLNLLEATRVFASTGNTKELRDACRQLDIPEQKTFFAATQELFKSILICNTKHIENKVIALSESFNIIKDADYTVSKPNEVIFKLVLIEAIEKKMYFINAACPIIELVQWCSDNWYIQQAITILRENIVLPKKRINDKQVRLDDSEYHILTCLRHSINHATGKASYTKLNLIDDELRKNVKMKVNNMLNDPNLIKGFINKTLNKIRKMCNIVPHGEYN